MNFSPGLSLSSSRRALPAFTPMSCQGNSTVVRAGEQTVDNTPPPKVWLREELGSTGFENHIAIPHGKSSGVSRTALAIGRTQHAIPWETMDGSDVRCVILFAVCLVDQNATHIRLLAQVSGSLADEDIIAKLLVESDPHKIIALFNSETENADA